MHQGDTHTHTDRQTDTHTHNVFCVSSVVESLHKITASVSLRCVELAVDLLKFHRPRVYAKV